MTAHYPLIAPEPPRLSELGDGLRAIEARGIYSNGGPVVRGFEAAMTERLFDGQGDTVALGSATLGLMLAIRHAATVRRKGQTLALVPTFTFAATAHAAIWAGLTPLLYDADPETWVPSPAAEEDLLRRFGPRIGVIVPYATFGNGLDLERYAWLAERYDVGIVVDAAASLGTLDADGRQFGSGAPFAIVYSMHATKAFATGEGGLVHSGDRELIADLRRMSNFGFGDTRSAELPGLNAKLPEVLGLQAAARLERYEEISTSRAAIGEAYRAGLASLEMQRPTVARQVGQFFSVLLPPAMAPRRAEIIAALGREGIGAGTYFSPHLAQQPYFQTSCLIEPTPVADDLAERTVSLPLTDRMTAMDATHICDRLSAILHDRSNLTVPAAIAGETQRIFSVAMIGAGPAGTAVLTAASKHGRLAELARDLVIVERGDDLGRGELGKYAIRSDSTAETFLTAIKDNPYADIAALQDHPVARHVARYIGDLGVPLVEAGPFVAATGARLGQIVSANGGQVLTRHDAVSAQRRADGLWDILLRQPDGATRTIVSRNVVLATGGYQSLEAVADASVSGASLADLAGERLLRSDDLLRVGGVEALRARLRGKRAPRIAIVGGSTSALAGAALLLKTSPALPLGAGGIGIFHRRPLRPFYPSADAARADGFHDFTDQDICPISGFVYRLAGFRLEARELVLRMLAVGGRAPDPRVALHSLADLSDEAAAGLLAEADVVVAATGYRPRALPLLEANGRPLSLRSDEGGAMVDGHCRIMNSNGEAVVGAYGIGLAAGFVPSGTLGGEPSFRGQANGLWLWQNDIGWMIAQQFLDSRQEAAA